jgi:hypothetical protein
MTAVRDRRGAIESEHGQIFGLQRNKNRKTQRLKDFH